MQPYVVVLFGFVFCFLQFCHTVKFPNLSHTIKEIFQHVVLERLTR